VGGRGKGRRGGERGDGGGSVEGRVQRVGKGGGEVVGKRRGPSYESLGQDEGCVVVEGGSGKAQGHTTGVPLPCPTQKEPQAPPGTHSLTGLGRKEAPRQARRCTLRPPPLPPGQNLTPQHCFRP